MLKRFRRYARGVLARITGTAAEEVARRKRAQWNHPKSAAVHDAKMYPAGDFFELVTRHLYLKHCSPGSKVLDVGCGGGRLTIALADHGCIVTAADISQPMLDILESKKEQRKITTICTDAAKLQLPDNSFDVVTSRNLMVHYPQWQDLLAEQVRCCRHGGTIVFNIGSQEHMDFARRTATNKFDWIYSIDVNDLSKPFFLCVTSQELESVCQSEGAEVVEDRPYGFFESNAIFSSSTSRGNVEVFESHFKRMLVDDRYAEFLADFEMSIVAGLPVEMSCFRMVAARKL